MISSSRLGGNNRSCPLYDLIYASFNSSPQKIYFLDSCYYNLLLIIVGQPARWREIHSRTNTPKEGMG